MPELFCDMLAAVQWVEDAVSAVDMGVSPMTSFYLHDGAIHANNGRMVAGHPFPFAGTALVPAKPFHTVLANRPDGECRWVAEGDVASGEGKLVLRRGRFRSSVKTLPVSEWVWPIYTPDIDPLPPLLLEALPKVMPFCSENATKPWATCIEVSRDYLYATNNVVLARASCPTTVPEFLLPRWAAEFILARTEGLIGWEVATNPETQAPQFVSFLWENGAWMRSTLLVERFPNVALMLADLADPEVAITGEWRLALTRVGRMLRQASRNDDDKHVVRLSPESVCGRMASEILEVEDGTGTPVPVGAEATFWDLRYLAPVAELATHWQPTAWPKPAAWRGPGVEGVIVGRYD